MKSAPRPVYPNSLTLFIIAGCFILIALDRTGVTTWLRPLVLQLYQNLFFLSAFALLLGMVSVLTIHLRRILAGEREWTYSLALVASCSALFVAGILQPTGVASPTVAWFFDYVIAPGQATLYAVVFFFMLTAVYRYLQLTTPAGRWMTVGAVLVLLTQMPTTHTLWGATLGEGMNWLLETPVMATLRGALLGSVLAGIVVGVRFLLGRAL
ncbi:MAG: hypothetical protein R3C14_02025 [Caldilineaceae bacterium]